MTRIPCWLNGARHLKCLIFSRSASSDIFVDPFVADRIPPANTMTDRYNIHSQLEHLLSRYTGTGHADTSRWEWLTNQHRDTCASIIGRFDMLSHVAVTENESIERVRFNMLEKMLQPCGPPPKEAGDG